MPTVPELLKSVVVQYVLSAAALYAIGKLLTLLSKDITARKASGKKDVLTTLLLQLESIADNVLHGLDEDVLPVLQRVTADGKVTSEEFAELKTAFVSAMEQRLTGSMKSQLSDLLGVGEAALEQFITGFLQRNLTELAGKVVAPADGSEAAVEVSTATPSPAVPAVTAVP
jgi:hypothetical protein